MFGTVNAGEARSRKRSRRIAFALVGLVGSLFVLQGYTARNYPEEDYPYYSGAFAPTSPEFTGALTVVSYNIWFGQDIEQATSELKQMQSLLST